MSHAPPAAPAAAAPSDEWKPGPLFDPKLPKDLEELKKKTFTLPAPNASDLCKAHVPGSLDSLPTLSLPPRPPGATYPEPDANKVVLVIPTENKDKVKLLTEHLSSANARKPEAVTLLPHRMVKADSGVGEQPYDDAGPRGAFTRVLSAARMLQADGMDKYRAELAEKGVGTVLVGSVENFMARGVVERPVDGVKMEMAVDYGFVVFCRIPLTGPDRRWEWKVGASRGVTAPVEYWRAAEKYGFEDEDAGKKHGKVTVGEVLEDNIPGIKKGNWQEVLAGESRFDLLQEALEEMGRKRMGVPWPVASAQSAAGTGVAPAAYGAAQVGHGSQGGAIGGHGS